MSSVRAETSNDYASPRTLDQHKAAFESTLRYTNSDGVSGLRVQCSCVDQASKDRHPGSPSNRQDADVDRRSLSIVKGETVSETRRIYVLPNDLITIVQAECLCERCLREIENLEFPLGD